MTQHTSGRLTVRGGFSIYADGGKTPVADTCLTNSVPANDEANARRLVACWNLLDGMPTSDIEGSALPEIIQNLLVAKGQRDELLEALKELDAKPEHTSSWIKARAAIAKAGGGV